jgi:3-oxoacyl-[acyl-carrier protein] reductase
MRTGNRAAMATEITTQPAASVELEQSLPGKRAIVTGGSSGIGAAIARAFSEHGAEVGLIARREERLREIESELPGRTASKAADVADGEAIHAAVDQLAQELGGLDILVNDAGFTHHVFTDTDSDEAERLWDEVVDANLKGAFLASHAAAPHLSRPGGRIINISSIAAYTGGSQPGGLAYAAAKSGLIGLTYALARELSPQGITANAIAPGFIPQTGFFGPDGVDEDRIKAVSERTPAGRPGEPEDIAGAAVYLASDAASFVTGQVIQVNGGWEFGR